MKIHIVQKGDTLWKLAQKYGVQFEELKSLNSQLSDPDMIMPGMKIKIPVSGKGSVSKGNTKINMGAKKEVPIMSPVQKKEYMQPKEMPVAKPKEMPVAKLKEMPVAKPKEMPVAKPKEMPVAKPKEMPVMPQPIVPEIDINNYYMVNMAKMDIHKPVVQPKPIVMKKEQPIKEKVVPKPQAPVVAEQCVPVTPLMPGTGFCPPFFPIYHPFHDAVMSDCMIQPLHEQEESSSLWKSPSHTQIPLHSGPYTQPVNPMLMDYQDCMPQMPIASVHGMQHHFESSSFPFDESSSHVGMESSSHFKPDGHHTGPMMMQQPVMQQPVIPSYVQPIQKKEDCGCGGPKPLGSTIKQSTYIPQTSMPNQPMYSQQPMMSQPGTTPQTNMPTQSMYSQQPMMSQPSTKQQTSMPTQPMYGQQPMMSQPSTKSQTNMPTQPMYSQQSMMNKSGTMPQTNMPTQSMYGQQPMMSQPGTMPQTNMPTQPMYGQQPMVSQPGITPQTSMPTQPMYGQQPMMSQPGITPQTSMPTQSMYGQQPAMMGQPNFTQQSMVPAYQPVHGQPHITTDRANYSQPTAPLVGYENRPFINQMEAVFPGMPQPSSEDALSMPRYADESYG